MAILIKSLADTQLTAASSDSSDATFIYQPVGRTAVVRNIRLVNADTAGTVPATVIVACHPGTASRDNEGGSPFPPRPLIPVNLEIAPKGMFLMEDEVTLDAVDELIVTLRRPGSGTAKLDVVVSGLERDL